jgi:outer membrane protein assembly factor BamB
MTYELGVDLGTTHSAAAVGRDGTVEMMSLGERSLTIPSVVFLTAEGTLVFGEAANRRGLFEPHRVAREFKRRIGDETPLILGGTPFAADVLTARLLRWIVDKVAAQEGSWPTALALTHPANWGPYKLDLLRQAVDHARLGDLPVTLLAEPVAAATHYAARERVDAGATVAVFDLGGGTFDAAVLRRTEDGFDLLGTPEGIERLGGIDFDAAVLARVRDTLGPQAFDLDPADAEAVGALARLRADCVEAKEALSADSAASIRAVLPTVQHTVRLTRDELEAMIRPALAETISALHRTVDSAGVTAGDLQAVLLVGGSSRIPLVAQMVSADLDRPVAVDAHPKHAVAQGAVLVAARPAATAAPPGDGTVSPGAVPAAASAAGPPEPPAGSPPRGVPPDPRRQARQRRTVIGLAAVLVVALLAGWLATRGDGAGPGPGSDRVFGADSDEEQQRTATVAEQWSVDTGADLVGVAIAGEMVVTLDSVGDVAGFDRSDGTERWRTSLGGEGVAGPKLSGGMAIVQVRERTQEATVVALDPASGDERWRQASAWSAIDTLGVGDGVVVVPTGDGLSSDTPPARIVRAGDGSTIADLAVGDELGLEAGDPAMVTDDLVVMSLGAAGEGGQQLVAYGRDDGEIAWEQGLSGGARMTTLVHGLVIRGVEDYPDDGSDITTAYQAIDVETGEEAWTAELDGAMGGPPVAAGDLVVLNHSGGDTGLVAVDPSSGEEAWAAAPMPAATPVALGDMLVAAGIELGVHDLADGAQLTAIDLPQGPNVVAAADDLAVVGSGRTLAAYSVQRDRSLQESWTFSDEAALVGTGAAGGDVVVVGTDRREVVALDRASGEERWRNGPYDEIDASGSLLQPTVTGDLVLVAEGVDDTEVVALSLADGEERWRVPVDGADDHLAAEEAGDLLVLGVDPLQGVDPDSGEVIWRRNGAFPTATGAPSSVALDGDGATVVTTGAAELAAYDGATGEPRWHADLPLDIYADDELTLDGLSGIAVSGDRVVVALTTSGQTVDRVIARSMADGRSLWEADVPGGSTSLAVGDGVAVTNPGEQVVALDLTSGEVAWEAAGQDSVSSLGLADGVVAVWGVQVLLVDTATGEVVDEVSTSEAAGSAPRAPATFGPPVVPPLVTDGLVVVQPADDTLLAYGY